MSWFVWDSVQKSTNTAFDDRILCDPSILYSKATRIWVAGDEVDQGIDVIKGNNTRGIDQKR